MLPHSNESSILEIERRRSNHHDFQLEVGSPDSCQLCPNCEDSTKRKCKIGKIQKLLNSDRFDRVIKRLNRKAQE